MSKLRLLFSVGLALCLLISVGFSPPFVHVPAAVVVWSMIAWLSADISRSAGRPKRWLIAWGVLAVIGAFLGTTDRHIAGLSVSSSGFWSAGSMIARAIALVLLGSATSSLIPGRAITDRLRNPVARHIVEVVVLASNLVPSLVQALSDAHATLTERRPGWRSLPDRLRLLAIHVVVRASRLADDVAFEMSLAEHNAVASTGDNSPLGTSQPPDRTGGGQVIDANKPQIRTNKLLYQPRQESS